MPYSRKTYRKKRTYSKKSKSYAPKKRYTKRLTSSSVPRSLMPDQYKRTLTYVDKISLDGGIGGTPSSWFFSCNSLYDPDRTGTGHQPRGFDQIMPMFDHYVVIASKMVATVVSRSDTAVNGRAIVAVKLRDTAAASTNMVDLLENGNVDYIVSGTAQANNGVKTISTKVNPNKFLARSKPLSDPDLKGTIASNPAEECFFEICAGAIGTDDPIAVDILVTIQYTAVFIEPKELARS